MGHVSDEVAVAEHLYRQIERMGDYDIPGLTVWGRSVGALCGDLLLKAPRPSGGVNILLGDFIGRGLPAAVGALPVAEVFYGMTQKGFSLSEIIEEINKKLRFVLPADLYCAACLIELDSEGKMLAVWNGGLPDLIVIDKHGKIKHRIKSRHIPLGVRNTDAVDLATVFIDVTMGDKAFLCTDGAITAMNQQGQAWGQARIESLLTKPVALPELAASLSAFIDGVNQVNDISILELDIAEIQHYHFTGYDNSNQTSLAPADWRASFQFSAQVLKQLDLVPMLMNMVMEIQAPHEHKQRIYTVLAELFNNALDHGVLKLDSSLKRSATGFAEYYAVRSQRLAELHEGFINISLQNQVCEQGGQLTICIEDSGQGFNYQQHAEDLASNKTLSGRGEALLRQLCREFAFSGKGNTATAVYFWSI